MRQYDRFPCRKTILWGLAQTLLNLTFKPVLTISLLIVRGRFGEDLATPRFDSKQASVFGADLSRFPRYLYDNAQSKLYFEVCFSTVNTGIVIFADCWTDVCTVSVD